MDPFKMIPPLEYKRENFFPCINEEYRRWVRAGFCFRSQEEIQFDEDGPEFLDDERDPFEYEKPNYGPGVYDGEPIMKGDHLDVISLLSGGCRDGRLIRCVNDNPYEFDRVGLKDSLENKKYVLLVCVFAPAKWCQYRVSWILCQLSILSSELLSSQPDDFEMVIVAKMRQDPCTGFEYDVDAFNQFLSAFPGRLAVPYSEGKTHDAVCAAFGFDGELKAILVGPDSSVLQDDVSFLIDYGSIGFPFTDDRIETLAKERKKLSLSGLLGRDPSFCLHKFKPHKGTESESETESRSIEQLNKKLVGLYLFQQGDKLPKIHEIYNQCRDRDRAKGIEAEFEIVIVCMPLYLSTHPQVFQEEVFALLNRLELDISSWWVFPYDNSVCLRLWEMSREHASAEDGMIIVGAHNSFFDPCGAHVISNFGMTAYPFTREVIVQRYVERAKQVTLESLLLPYQPVALNRKKIYASMTRVERDGEQVPLIELQGKNVLFYLHNEPVNKWTFFPLVDWYPKIKDIDPGCELIFVIGKDSDVDPADIPKSWLVCVCEREHLNYLSYNHDAFYYEYIRPKFFKGGLGKRALLAFGKDGYIHSLNAQSHGCNVYPFHPDYKDLRREIICRISDDLYFMDGYQWESRSLQKLSL